MINLKLQLRAEKLCPTLLAVLMSLFVAGMQWKIFRLIATDFACWVPISILSFLSISGVTLSEEAHVVSAVVLLPINSALNPLLYSDVFSHVVRSVRTRKSQSPGSNSTASTNTKRKISKGTVLPGVRRNTLETI